MPVFKNEDNGTWYVMARYVNWKGERKQKCKRGFATKKEEMCIRDSHPVMVFREYVSVAYSTGYIPDKRCYSR